LERGLVHCYTGDGKGKTTAALGLTLRAAGRGFKCCVVQFMKHCPDCGEAQAYLKWLVPAGAELRQFGRPPKEGEQFAWVDPKHLLPEDRAGAQQGFAFATEAVNSRKFDLVVLDEINLAVACGLVEEQRVLDLLRNKPDSVEIVLTGRKATENLMAAADLVTEMKDIKHPLGSGVRARVGIDY